MEQGLFELELLLFAYVLCDCGSAVVKPGGTWWYLVPGGTTR